MAQGKKHCLCLGPESANGRLPRVALQQDVVCAGGRRAPASCSPSCLVRLQSCLLGKRHCCCVLVCDRVVVEGVVGEALLIQRGNGTTQRLTTTGTTRPQPRGRPGRRLLLLWWWWLLLWGVCSGNKLPPQAARKQVKLAVLLLVGVSILGRKTKAHMCEGEGAAHCARRHMILPRRAGVVSCLLLPVDTAQHSMLQLQRLQPLLLTQHQHLRGKGGCGHESCHRELASL